MDMYMGMDGWVGGWMDGSISLHNINRLFFLMKT
jgi:hypothetical protein